MLREAVMQPNPYCVGVLMFSPSCFVHSELGHQRKSKHKLHLFIYSVIYCKLL